MRNVIENEIVDIRPMSFYPRILVPVPKKAMEVIDSRFEGRKNQIAKRLLIEFSKKYIKSFEYIPFCCKMKWDSEKIRGFEGSFRGIFQKQLVPLFFESNQSYSAGNYAKSFRYKPELLGSEYVLFGSQYDFKNRTRLHSRNDDLISNQIIEKAKDFLLILDFRHVNLCNEELAEDLKIKADLKVLNLLKVKIEGNQAKIDGINLNKTSTKSFKPFEIQSNKIDNLKSLERELYYQRNRYRTMKWSLKLHIRRDDITNRLHSNISNLTSETLKYISMRNEKLKEIDMRNCHYTLFSNLLIGYDKDFTKLLEQTITYNNVIETHKSISHLLSMEQEINNIHTPSPNMLSHNTENKFTDLSLFIKSSFNGTVYKEIGEVLFGSEYKPENRKHVKLVLMKIFYGKYNSKPSSNEVKFKKYFPTVYDIVKDLKVYMHKNFDQLKDTYVDLFAGCNNSKVKKSLSNYAIGNNSLSIMLMNLEAKIFVDLILAQLQESGFDVITKHDSILAKESEYEVVKRFIEEILNHEFGEGMFALK